MSKHFPVGILRLRFYRIARKVTIAAAVTGGWLALHSDLNAQEIRVELDPERTIVEFTLDATMHTVHGHFKLKNGSMLFDPSTGAANGAITVDATSGDTGNTGRDHKMHKDVLESGRYPDITFTPQRVIGKVDLPGNSKVDVEGVLRVHGEDHPTTLSFAVDATGNNEVKASTQFPIPYQKWGMKNPGTFFLHVKDEVQVQISATGRIVR